MITREQVLEELELARQRSAAAEDWLDPAHKELDRWEEMAAGMDSESEFDS